jgi:hypothetical protein
VGDQQRSVAAELDYELATRYFASAFEYCGKLPVGDRRSLLRNISQQVSERLSEIEEPNW